MDITSAPIVLVMIYCTLEPLSQGQWEGMAGDFVGARQAHDGLLQSVLPSDTIQAVHLFGKGEQQNPAVRVLQRQFGVDRVLVKALAELPVLAQDNQYLFVSRASRAAQVCNVRAALGTIAFPVCGILHSLHWDDMLGGFSRVLLSFERCDTLVATSQAAETAASEILHFAARWLRDRHGISSFELPQIARSPLGIDTAYFHPGDRNECRDFLRLPSDSKVLLYFGRLSRRHKADLEGLLSVSYELLHKHPQLVLMIAGHDHENYAQHLKTVASNLEIGERVHWFLDVAPSLRRLLYSAADIFVSPPDNIQESFGLTLLEAMASGLPVVASDWSGYRDLVIDGVTGRLVKTYWNPIASAMMSWISYDSSDAESFLAERTLVDLREMREAIDDLLSNAQVRCEMGSKGSHRVRQEFSLEATAQRFVNIWQGQLATPRSESPRAVAIDYGELFRHYASHELHPEMLVTLTAVGQRLRSSPATNGTGNQILSPDVFAILQATDRNPREIGSLISELSPMGFEVIVRLLKQGYLQVGAHQQVVAPNAPSNMDLAATPLGG